MKKLKYLLFLFIIFLNFNVFADTTYDMTNKITSPVNFTECGVGSYTGIELNGSTNCWNTNVRNYGTLSRIYFNLPAPTGSTFETDTAYRLSLYMATNDWRNRFGTVIVNPGSSYTNNFVDSFTFVSMKQVNITFTVPYGGSTTYQTLWVDLPATNTNTLITGETNWNLSKVTLTKLSSGSSGGSTTPSGPSSSFDDTAIINNQNENTQDIINNNNSNTQDIINNNNSNSQEIINNQNENTDKIVNELSNVCSNILNLSVFNTCRLYTNSGDIGDCNRASISSYNNNSGSISFTTSDNWGGINSPIIEIKPSTEYHLKFTRPSNFDGIFKISFYDTDSNFINQINWWNSERSFTTPYNAKYLRLAIEQANTTSSTMTFTNLSLGTSPNFCVFGSTISKLDNTTNAINETNDYLKDDSDPTISDSALNDVFGRVHFTDPLSYLLTLPTQLINKIVSLSDTCSPIDLGTLYGVHLTLPCINLENYLGSSLWSIIDIILSVGLLSVILKNFYDTISNLLTLGGEKEAKEKFSMPTPMDFLATILGGDK